MSVRDDSPVEGFTLSRVETFDPAYEAVTVTAVAAATVFVFTVKVPVVEPAAIDTLEGTVVAVELLVEIVIVAPPAGAGPFRVTVAVEEPPPVTEAGFAVRVLSATAGVFEYRAW